MNAWLFPLAFRITWFCSISKIWPGRCVQLFVLAFWSYGFENSWCVLILIHFSFYLPTLSRWATGLVGCLSSLCSSDHWSLSYFLVWQNVLNTSNPRSTISHLSMNPWFLLEEIIINTLSYPMSHSCEIPLFFPSSPLLQSQYKVPKLAIQLIGKVPYSYIPQSKKLILT